jgi:hypothetical protein
VSMSGRECFLSLPLRLAASDPSLQGSLALRGTGPIDGCRFVRRALSHDGITQWYASVLAAAQAQQLQPHLQTPAAGGSIMREAGGVGVEEGEAQGEREEALWEEEREARASRDRQQLLYFLRQLVLVLKYLTSGTKISDLLNESRRQRERWSCFSMASSVRLRAGRGGGRRRRRRGGSSSEASWYLLYLLYWYKSTNTTQNLVQQYKY